MNNKNSLKFILKNIQHIKSKNTDYTLELKIIDFKGEELTNEVFQDFNFLLHTIEAIFNEFDNVYEIRSDFKLKPEILKASVILKILPRLSDRISNKEVILPCDFERIIPNIDLFDEKYGLIIKSDDGKSLNPIVDLYIESSCGMYLNAESNKEIPFLDFLELFYQDKSKWKFKKKS